MIYHGGRRDFITWSFHVVAASTLAGAQEAVVATSQEREEMKAAAERRSVSGPQLGSKGAWELNVLG